jgi:hypothetical protein
MVEGFASVAGSLPAFWLPRHDAALQKVVNILGTKTDQPADLQERELPLVLELIDLGLRAVKKLSELLDG